MTQSLRLRPTAGMLHRPVLRAVGAAARTAPSAPMASATGAHGWPAVTAPRPASPARDRLRAHYRHLTLWTFQAWLAMFFIAAGYTKLTEPAEILILLLGWPQFLPLDVVRAIGLVEVVLAGGMLMPLFSWRVWGPVMAVAAIALFGLTAFMLALHLSRLEPGLGLVNLILAALAMLVLVGRMKSPAFGEPRR